MNNKIDFKLSTAIAQSEASGSKNATLCFFFRASAGFRRNAAGTPLNEDGTPVVGIDIRSAPQPGKTEGIYTASGTIDGIKALSLNPNVTSLSGSTRLESLGPT